MNIQEVATSETHRHSAFAKRVLEDKLAWWACFLHAFEKLIKNRGGTVRPRVEFSERQARLKKWREKMCAKFDVEPERRVDEPLLTNPDQGLFSFAPPSPLPPFQAPPQPLPPPQSNEPEFGMDDDFFSMLIEDEIDFFA